MKVRYLLEGSGVAILVLLPYIWPQVSPYHAAIYFSILPTTSVTGAILIDFLVLAALCAVLIALLSRPGGDVVNHRYAWGALIAIVIAAAVTSIAKLAEVHRFVPNSAVLVSFILLAAWLVRYWSPANFQAIVLGFRVILALIGLCTFWMAPQLLFMAFHGQASDQLAFRNPVNASPPPRRIIWILFDELSYAQAFESRDASLVLPNFDWLRERSTLFSELSPAGYYTVRVVPSFLIGRQVQDLRSTLDGQALIRLEKSSHWQQLDPRQTIFAEAQRDGWTTGVAGWSNPYCRLLSPVLNSCYWLPDQFTPGFLYSHMSPRRSALKNAFAPLANSILRLQHKPSQDPGLNEFHRRDAEELIAPAMALIRDEQMGFVFIHLAVPHPPGVYDRRTEQTRNSGSYLDNMALADRDLGELLTAVSSTNRANRTTVVVCSDHSWRVPMWRNSLIWTQEDERASNGFFDSRPVLMVHFPEQTEGQLVNQPMSSLIVHEIMQDLLQGKILGEKGLETWVSRYDY